MNYNDIQRLLKETAGVIKRLDEPSLNATNLTFIKRNKKLNSKSKVAATALAKQLSTLINNLEHTDFDLETHNALAKVKLVAQEAIKREGSFSRETVNFFKSVFGVTRTYSNYNLAKYYDKNIRSTVSAVKEELDGISRVVQSFSGPMYLDSSKLETIKGQITSSYNKYQSYLTMYSQIEMKDQATLSQAEKDFLIHFAISMRKEKVRLAELRNAVKHHLNYSEKSDRVTTSHEESIHRFGKKNLEDFRLGLDSLKKGDAAGFISKSLSAVKRMRAARKNGLAGAKVPGAAKGFGGKLAGFAMLAMLLIEAAKMAGSGLFAAFNAVMDPIMEFNSDLKQGHGLISMGLSVDEAQSASSLAHIFANYNNLIGALGSRTKNLLTADEVLEVTRIFEQSGKKLDALTENAKDFEDIIALAYHTAKQTGTDMPDVAESIADWQHNVGLNTEQTAFALNRLMVEQQSEGVPLLTLLGTLRITNFDYMQWMEALVTSERIFKKINSKKHTFEGASKIFETLMDVVDGLEDHTIAKLDRLTGDPEVLNGLLRKDLAHFQALLKDPDLTEMDRKKKEQLVTVLQSALEGGYDSQRYLLSNLGLTAASKIELISAAAKKYIGNDFNKQMSQYFYDPVLFNTLGDMLDNPFSSVAELHKFAEGFRAVMGDPKVLQDLENDMKSIREDKDAEIDKKALLNEDLASQTNSMKNIFESMFQKYIKKMQGFALVMRGYLLDTLGKTLNIDMFSASQDDREALNAQAGLQGLIEGSSEVQDALLTSAKSLYRAKGLCYSHVFEVYQQTFGDSGEFGKIPQYGGSTTAAADAWMALSRDSRFKEVTGITPAQLQDPAFRKQLHGAIIVYQRGVRGHSRNYGHIEFYDAKANAGHYGLGAVKSNMLQLFSEKDLKGIRFFVPVATSIKPSRDRLGVSHPWLRNPALRNPYKKPQLPAVKPTTQKPAAQKPATTKPSQPAASKPTAGMSGGIVPLVASAEMPAPDFSKEQEQSAKKAQQLANLLIATKNSTQRAVSIENETNFSIEASGFANGVNLNESDLDRRLKRKYRNG